MESSKPLKYPTAPELRGMHLTSKCALVRCVEDIKAKFAQNADKPSKRKARQKTLFKNSCFGRLFEQMHQLTFCGGLVHSMLARQVEPPDESLMEFNIFGQSAVFSLKEFGLITGLKLHGSSNARPPPSQRLINTYFDGKRVIRPSVLRDVVVGLRIKDLEEEDDLVKLCLLYFLECGVLCGNHKSSINMDHFSMVEDLAYFNQHPWGLESYQLLMESLHKAFKKDDALNNSSTYTLCGMPLAFQVCMLI